jgi:hypothetical protein
MQFFFDHLSSILIAGVLILGLQLTQARSRHAGIEQVASHSVKAKTLVFGEWIEHDILNLGENFGTNPFRIMEPDTSAIGNTTEWEFYSDSVYTQNGVEHRDRITKRYRLVPTRTAYYADADTTYQLYRVDRDTTVMPVVNGVPTPPGPDDWVESTRSISTLSFFRIDLLGSDGTTPRDYDGAVELDAVDYVRVRFGIVPEYVLRPDNYIRELYWTKTLKIRPYWTPQTAGT